MPPGNTVKSLYPNTVTPLINEITDPFTVTELDIRIPFVNTRTGGIDYTEVNESNMFDFAVGGSAASAAPNLMHWVLQFAMANYNNPVWKELTDLTTKQFFILEPGDNIVFKPGVARLDIVLDTVGDTIDYWYGTKRFAKFGVVTWGVFQGQQLQPVWINSPVQTVGHQSRLLQFDGAIVNLQPGCRGSVYAYSRLAVPNIQYNVNNSGWQEFVFPG